MVRPEDLDADAAFDAQTELGRIANNYARYAKDLEARITSADKEWKRPLSDYGVNEPAPYMRKAHNMALILRWEGGE